MGMHVFVGLMPVNSVGLPGSRALDLCMPDNLALIQIALSGLMGSQHGKLSCGFDYVLISSNG